MENLPLYVSLATFGIVTAVVGWWGATSFLNVRQKRRGLSSSRENFESSVREIESKIDTQQDESAWVGFRKFVVDRLETEAKDVTSVYLRPQDGKPLRGFLPGQFLTFQLKIPGEAAPTVRCYSLSTSPNRDYYRCSIKKVPPPRDRDDLPSGKSSTYFNDVVQEGEVLDVKSPSGAFFLDMQSTEPVVLLAAGIGITPIFSMLKTVSEKQPERKVVLFYGSLNAENHAFKSELRRIKAENPNIQVVDCYSHPTEHETEGVDFDYKGWVSADLLKETLPSNKFHFYMCGPPPFMEAVYKGLIDWGVPDQRVHFEAFGPASIKKANEARDKDKAEESSTTQKSTLNFALSGEKVDWSEEYDSILEAAEENDIQLESGCRSGNCGACKTKLLSGEVTYSREPTAECGPDECLVCIAKPKSDLEIDA